MKKETSKDENKATTMTVDDYLAAVPEKKRTALERVRKIIKATAPDVVEAISYHIVVFKHKGMLVGLSAWKDHCSLHIMGTSVMKEYKEVLKPFGITTATVHFTPEKPLPEALVVELVKARVKENEERAEAKQKKVYGKGK